MQGIIRSERDSPQGRLCLESARRGGLTARAARTSDGVLGLCFLAVALESGLLAAGALGLLGADAGLAGAAAAGGWDCHGGALWSMSFGL